VVKKRDDRLDPALPQALEPRAHPRPSETVWLVERTFFPQHRIPDGRNSKIRQQIDVCEARFMSGLGKLIAHHVVRDPRDAGLRRRPNLERELTVAARVQRRR
jgi:hypothetical protein